MALAVAYQVQCRLTESMPVMERGLNHPTQQAISVAAGVAKALELDVDRTAHAIAVGAADSVAPAVTQAEPVSNWKGLSSGDTAMRAVHNTLLARCGVIGPLELFDGHAGLEHVVGQRIRIDWTQEGLDVVGPDVDQEV
jgi:2-methylcitrate dehydratase